MFEIVLFHTAMAMDNTAPLLWGEALMKNTTLTELSLSCMLDSRNQGKKGSHGMIGCVCPFVSKTKGQEIGETGAKYFADALKTNTTLKKLSFYRKHAKKPGTNDINQQTTFFHYQQKTT